MTQPEHTKTPWEYETFKDDDGVPDEHFIYGFNNHQITSLDNKEDAELIVKAVNNHADLVEALEIIRDLKGLSIESIKALAKETLLRVK